MSVIIGSATSITIDNKTDGFQSVQWATQVTPNRLWQVGDWTPYRTQVTKVLTASVTTYAGVLSPLMLSPSNDCSDSTAKKDVNIVAANCSTGGSLQFIETGMYIMSYSYSKSDPNSFGTETWSLQKWVDAGFAEGDTQFINTGAPSFVIQGISEGTRSGDASNLGVSFSSDGQVSGSQGNVTAGFPGIGSADTTTYGIVTGIGGGTLQEAGKIGQSSVSIPHQPLYIG